MSGLRYALLLALTLCLISGAWGEDAKPSMDEALEALEAAIEQDAGLAPATKDALRRLAEALRAEKSQATDADTSPPDTRSPGTSAPATRPPSEAEIARAVDEYMARRPPAPAPEKPIWESVLGKLALYGDFRLRHESDFDLDDKKNRNRERIRLRLGVNYQLVDEVLFGARIVTGDRDDPRSPHVTLGDVFDKLEIDLDRAFLAYRPTWLEGSVFTGGKFNHPFYQNPVYKELVWDADVQPEGVVGTYTIPGRGPLETLDLRAGQYIMLEQADASDAHLSVFQLGGRFAVVEGLGMNLAVGYYLYDETTPDGSDEVLKENRGNATIDKNGDGQPDKFRSRFGILNPILAFTYSGWKLPLVVSGEYILNTEASGGRDQGWAVGTAVGSTRSQGDWRFYYQWQIVEQDAVFSPFTQDDFLLATNHRSHAFGVNYQVFDKMGLHLWGLVSARDKTGATETTDSDKDQWRVRVDLDVRF